MRKFTMLLLLLACFALPARSRAQDEGKPAEPPKTAEPAHYYRVTFTVQEVDAAGKPTNSRSYTTILSTSTRQVSIRTGVRITFVTQTNQDGNAVQTVAENVGVNIDVQQVQEIGRNLAMTIRGEVIGATKAEDPKVHDPEIRRNTWDAPVLVPVGKPTVVFTSDDLDSKGSMQMVVTATPVQ